jgi:hypothetical protein
MATRYQKFIGGLLGEDVEGMSEEERKQLSRQGTTSAVLGLLGGQGLMGGLSAYGEQRAAKRKKKATEEELGRITGRLFGGAPAAPEDMGEDETGLGPVAIKSQYRQDPQDALRRMLGTQEGRDIAAASPDLFKLAQEGVTGRTVGGAVYNPLTGEFSRPPTAQIKTLTPQEISQLGLPRGTIAQIDEKGELKIVREPKAAAGGGGAIPTKDLSKDERDRIFKARDRIASSVESISGLSAARQLSNQAYEGPLAGARAQAAAALPDQIEPAGAKETIEFDMILKQQVLPQLKTIFGAAPTEGERKILLDLQGSSSLPRAVRNKMLDNAIAAANRRMQADQEEVQSLLGGSYFKTPERGGPSMPKVPTPATSPKVDYIFRNGKLVKAE